MFAARNMMFASGLDPAIIAFRTASGATDLAANDALARYIRAQGLMSATRCYPMKSAQNAGSGATVYGWGDLTANNITLVNSPVWGASGITFVNSASRYGNAGDFISGGNLTCFARGGFASSGNNVGIFAAQDNGGVSRGWYFNYQTSGILRVLRSSNGTDIEVYDTAPSVISTSDTCYSCQFVEGSGRSIWKNKTNQAISLFAGTPQTSLVNSSLPVLSGANLVSGSPANFFNGVKTCDLFIAASVTDAQREAITDLVNAL